MTNDYSRVCFVMTQPSHPGNVGAAARAIKTMGFADLVLVEPRMPDIAARPEAVAMASGATDVLAQARVCATLEQALADVTLAFALTARPRDLGPPACDIRQAARMGREHLDAHPEARVAMVVGTERAGLTNAQIDLCHRVCHIPANPAYSSLNVAQALQLAAWELRYALMMPDGREQSLSPVGRAHSGAAPRHAGAEPASGQAVQAFLAHWEQALVEVGFLDPAHPKKLMPRMRHLFARAGLTRDEVDMLRGVCTAMQAAARRTGRG